MILAVQISGDFRMLHESLPKLHLNRMTAVPGT
jgi:hypothetical protein